MIGFGMPGMTEWLVILVIVLIFFGAGRLPEVFGQAGKAIKSFKDGADGRDVTPNVADDAATAPRSRKQIAHSDTDDLDDDAEKQKASARPESKRAD